MKKYLLMAVAFVAAISANAQTEGKNSVEIGFNPFSNGYQTFRIDELKYRHYWGANALRVRVGLGVQSTKNNTTTTTDIAPTFNLMNGTTGVNEGTWTNVVTGSSPINQEDAQPNGYQATPNINQTVVTDKNSRKDMNFMFAVGYEREFKVAQRVSLFAGAEFFYSHVSANLKQNTTTETTVDYLYNNGTTYQLDKVNSTLEFTQTTKGQGARNTIGINAVGGIDFHVYKGLYLGAELGLGVGHTISGKAAKVTSERTFEGTETHQYKSGATYTTNYESASNWTRKIDGGVETYSSTATATNYVTGSTSKTTLDYTKIDPTEVETKNHNTNFRLYAEPALRIGYRF